MVEKHETMSFWSLRSEIRIMIGMNFKRKRNIKENIMLIIRWCMMKQDCLVVFLEFISCMFSQWFWQVFHKLDEKEKKKFLCMFLKISKE